MEIYHEHTPSVVKIVMY